MAVIGVIPFLPESFPGTSLGVAWAIITLQVMKKHMPSKEQISESEEYRFRSNWAVILVAIVALAVTIALAIPWLFASEAMGWVGSA